MRGNSRQLCAGDRSSVTLTLGVSFSFAVAVWLSPSLFTVKALVGWSLMPRTVGHAQLTAALFSRDAL